MTGPPRVDVRPATGWLYSVSGPGGSFSNPPRRSSSVLVLGRGRPRAVGGRRRSVEVQALDVVRELHVGLDKLAAGGHARVGLFFRSGRARKPLPDPFLDVMGDPFHELVGVAAASASGLTHLRMGVTSPFSRATLASATTGPSAVSQWATAVRAARIVPRTKATTMEVA